MMPRATSGSVPRMASWPDVGRKVTKLRPKVTKVGGGHLREVDNDVVNGRAIRQQCLWMTRGENVVGEQA